MMTVLLFNTYFSKKTKAFNQKTGLQIKSFLTYTNTRFLDPITMEGQGSRVQGEDNCLNTAHINSSRQKQTSLGNAAAVLQAAEV